MMPFIFNRPQEQIVPFDTLLRINREAFARVREQQELNLARLKLINEQLEQLLHEIEESQQ